MGHSAAVRHQHTSLLTCASSSALFALVAAEQHVWLELHRRRDGSVMGGGQDSRGPGSAGMVQTYVTIFCVAGAIQVLIMVAVGILRRSRSSLFLKEAKRVLLVIAHPDDESMFFSPTLKLLQSLNGERGQTKEVSILCLSNGNFAGLGSVREKELTKAAESFGIPSERVTTLNDDRMQVRRVGVFLKKWKEREGGGVKGNKGKATTSTSKKGFGVAEGTTPRVLMLDSEKRSVLRRYWGPLEIFFLWASALRRDTASLIFGSRRVGEGGKGTQQRPSQVFECAVESSVAALGGMVIHWSQFVWYRLLFVLFSCYAYGNTYTELSGD
uniref:N-acetylglucosaminylphosphatidylinositol deacetylase n=1 Tax=Chromera velia CCMP2878 TaxID=1169474 RepID=A0A0G4FLU6_9ALVE|eukprot:Cvel_17683.t1-p1 / transcript=Cvel_17683.t1 / gene=Cvel_17683 / organism=Chromera_velia_CCMP2878 / gene_product=Probable N-acetylglucosaminyl-phosphatidylinositol, putative / transcript_product=Probable N-acetylglucosaminyl-phosphatidylinositol, putative / location=Cvel_scaffold1426:30063-34766(-) / protein_length=326 / sequence_SO=supercontig / SO=protein_coding / is_pseudo=false